MQEKKQESEQKTTHFGFKQVLEEEKAQGVKKVFDSVAKKYDLMNDLLSLGLHRWWKHCAINKSEASEGQKILDIASGTCDLAIAFGKRVGKTGEVWATDINYAMLAQGLKCLRQTGTRAQVAQCDCENLPFKDNTFDVATVSFGLRNMTHKDRALAEMCRVVKPGGRVIVLEFSRCAKFFKPIYDFYSFVFMPWLGSKIAGDAESYRYLAESIRMHPDQPTLAGMMRDVGMEQVQWTNLTFGVCAIHMGFKPKQ
ncbi:MAG: bifunctional demethylmenaquinone methyltransferase/2-methoxy-6-polyprenyl-1,4-benzoquinol methylase UbiE [Duodenibacillus sp.]|nr:bifunctional demethylmenaquinone methyltransferase/2-methoxy-6-polyprenyl-1,4-benzoquinol methylase UbiE [Duodenibacillus sp.]